MQYSACQISGSISQLKFKVQKLMFSLWGDKLWSNTYNEIVQKIRKEQHKVGH